MDNSKIENPPPKEKEIEKILRMNHLELTKISLREARRIFREIQLEHAEEIKKEIGNNDY